MLPRLSILPLRLQQEVKLTLGRFQFPLAQGIGAGIGTESLSPAEPGSPSRGPRIYRQRFSALEVAVPIGYSHCPERGGTRHNTAVKRCLGTSICGLGDQRFGHQWEDFNVEA